MPAQVGNTNTRWASGPPCLAPTATTTEPKIPWCGLLWPDLTPVSYTEAAAVRRYLGGATPAQKLFTSLALAVKAVAPC